MPLWQDRRVLIAGEPSLVGSRLADVLVERGAKVRVVDDLLSGEPGNAQQ
jgi:nucleoside-diphosphate-sugar epimerase